MQYSINPSGSLTKIVAGLLQQLHVNVTKTTIQDTLENHPDYPSILSISDALKQWKVDSFIIRADKEKLHELPVPFIANIQGNNPFITVTNVTPDYVVYTNGTGGGVSLNKTIDAFLKEWSGVTLLAEATANAGEKNYKQSRKKEILHSFTLPFIFAAVIAFIVYSTISKYYNFAFFTPLSLLLFLKLAGGTVSLLLLWFEIDKANPLLKQICSMGSQTNCSAVLNSKQSKLFNTVSWSEIGFAYFAGGVVSLMAAGSSVAQILPIIACFNVLALPYTVFSVYYQWKVAKQWCVLCLTVQSILVAECITALTTHLFSLSSVNSHLLTPSLSSVNSHLLTPSLSSVIFILSSFLAPALAWFLLKPVLLQNQEAKRKKRELLRFKYDSRIFAALLPKQKHITTDPAGLGITIGNPAAANTIVKVCNPYCGPCANAHPKIEKLLEDNNDLKVQILFTALNDEKDKRSLPVKHLLAVAEKQNEALTKQALDDWYLPSKKDYDAFAAKYPMNGELKKQGAKVEAMDKWCKQTGIAFTPTFFINGYQLPDVYSIGDLQYFLHSIPQG